MQSIRTLNDMIVFLQQRGDKKRVAVVCANDASTRYAIEKGVEASSIPMCSCAPYWIRRMVSSAQVMYLPMWQWQRFPSTRSCSSSPMQL